MGCVAPVALSVHACGAWLMSIDFWSSFESHESFEFGRNLFAFC